MMLQEIGAALLVFGPPVLIGIFLCSGNLEVGEVEFKNAIDMQTGEIAVGAFVDGVSTSGNFSQE